MQSLDKDQPGSLVEWKKVFEEDREFNQGEFAESIRDQFLQVRVQRTLRRDTTGHAILKKLVNICFVRWSSHIYENGVFLVMIGFPYRSGLTFSMN